LGKYAEVKCHLWLVNVLVNAWVTALNAWVTALKINVTFGW
jgi:hypothetical protein